MTELYYVECEGCKTNVGDMIGPYLMKKITGTTHIHAAPGRDMSKSCISMVGSIARDSNLNSIIAGVGILISACKIKAFKECWAVRGKYTLEKIKETCKNNNYNINCDDIVLGDPGILMPYFYPKYCTFKIQKKYKYGVILHYVDNNEKYKSRILDKDVHYIDVSLPVEKFIDELLLCENIISSSLHGVVLGNAYRIPTCWIRMDGTILPKDDIKFHDYFSAIYEDKKNCFVIDRPINISEIPRDYYIIAHDEFTFVQQKLYDRLLTNILALHGKKTNHIYSCDGAANVFEKYVSGKENYFFNRIGGNELDIYVKYIQSGRDIKAINTDAITNNIKKYAGYYDPKNNPKILKFFLDKFEESYAESDVVMVANSALSSALGYIQPTDQYYKASNDESFKNIAEQLMEDKTCIKFHYIESLNKMDSWFRLLNGKRVLIVSPFTNEIKKQLKNKHNLFKDVNFQKINYPEFARVEYITTPLTMDGFNIPHENWKETYHDLCRQVRNKKREFDVALLMCGSYASPLGLYIKKIYRSAIYLGGIGQLLFGIKGSRYMIPYYTRFMNEHWIYPELSNKLKMDPDYCRNEGFKAYF